MLKLENFTLSDGISINKAAKMLGKTPSTVRRWVQKGCPCVRPGETGRGKGAILSLDDVMAWRGGGHVMASDDERLQFIATVLMDCIKRDEVHLRVDVTQREMAALLVLVFQRYWLNLTHRAIDELQDLPEEIKQLLAIYVE